MFRETFYLSLAWHGEMPFKIGVCPVVTDNDADLLKLTEEEQDRGYVSL